MAKKGKELTLEEKLEQALVPAEEQPYEVPENWCWTVLEKLSSVISKGTTPKGSKDAYVDDGINFLRVENIGEDGTISINGMKHIAKDVHCNELKRSILMENDVLVSIAGSLGKTAIVGKTQLPLNTNQAIAFIRLRDSEKVNPKYVRFYLSSPMAQELLLGKTKVTSIPNLTLKIVSDIALPLPPLAEQQRIVDRIESLFAKLDEAKEKIQNVLDESENRKNAILHKAFTGELTKKWREENRINKEDTWESVALKDCGVWGGGGTPNTSKDEYWNNGDIMWITSKDMKSDIIEDTQLHVNMEGINNSAARYCEEPSVLFVMRSGILRRTLPVSMVKKGFCVNQDLKFLTPHDIEIEYLFWVCKAFEKDILQTCKKDGTTVESIEASRLLSYEIPLPSKEEREKIIAMARAFSEYENNIKKVAENVLYGIENVKKSILAKAFRGELGTNDSSDEDAIELLKSVLEA